MKWSSHPVIEQWLSTFNQYPKNDALVNLDNALSIPFHSALEWSDKSVQKIIQQANDSIKTFGVNPLSIVRGVVTKIGEEITCIPFQLYETQFEIEKIKNRVRVEKQEESVQINPFLIHRIQSQFDLTIANDEWAQIDLLKSKYGIIIKQLDSEWIGNFHPNRYILRNELVAISQSDTISKPLHDQLEWVATERTPLKLPTDEIVYLDDDQAQAIQELEANDIVVEGPPGTGKSQLLIGILGKILLKQQKALIASAKQTALDVIEKRMNQLHLGGFLFGVNDAKGLQPIYQRLATQWQRLEQYEIGKNQINLRPQIQQQLQFKLDLWNQRKLIGEGSWKEFQELNKRFPKENGMWIGSAPTLLQLQTYESVIHAIYTNSSNELVYALGDKIKECSAYELLIELQNVKDFLSQLPNSYTFNAIENLIPKQISYQLYQTEFAQKHQSLLNPDGKERKRFIKQIRKIDKLSVEVQLLEKERAHWKRELSLIELDNYAVVAEQTGWWTQMQWRKKWKALSSAPIDLAPDLIHQERIYKKKSTDLALLLSELSENHSIEELHRTVTQLSIFSAAHWKRMQACTSFEIGLFDRWNTEFEKKISAIKKIRWNVRESMISQVENWIQNLANSLPIYQSIQTLPDGCIRALETASSFFNYMCNATHTHWKNFEAHYPQIATWNEQTIQEPLMGLESAINTESNILVEKIYQLTRQRFDHYHQLIATPSSYLDEAQKSLKKELKKGKAILIKEFAKKQQHLKLRILLSSEARHWIDVLQPIQLSNAIQLAMHAPLNREMYDIAIIDEASQLLSSHSAGILQRSKAILIAGDDQQMQPHHFFQSNEDRESLMQRAKYVLPNRRLKHHYRSSHSDLIDFSNRHFYNNELSVFTEYNAAKAIYHYPVSGQFVAQQNIVEAQQVIAIMERLLLKNETVGIVAFSQNQIELIRKSIPKSLSEQILEREENGSLFLLPLDKIQGDECEHLIISCTYGPNEENKTVQRFGLLSLKGGRNRLNVLSTRASKTLHVVSSLNSEEIHPTTNVNTELFKQWLHFIEQKSKSTEMPINDNSICIPLHEGLTLREIMTQKRTFSARGWNIKYH